MQLSDSDTEMFFTLSYNEINGLNTGKRPTYAEIEIAGSGRIKFQIDYGPTVNVIP